MKTTLLTILCFAMMNIVKAQQYSELVNKELQFVQRNGSNTLYLANINGGIEVEGYDGDIIEIKAKIDVMAKTEVRLEEAKNAIQIAVIDRVDTIALFVTNPCSTYGKLVNWTTIKNQERSGDTTGIV